uniref:Odorant-binding protein 16 n=1 Tax=Chouioia cunea TaxID=1570515 RepID=A0A6B9CIH7_9HYME|nr:odorant-binding protein 16 [Chouioia cunea]
MKVLLVLVCCLAVAMAQFSSDKQRASAMNECQEELKVPDSEVEDPSKLGCLYACMHKKVGYTDADGTYNLRKLAGSAYNQRFEEAAQRVMNMCAEQAKGDPCKMALCLETTKEF